MRQAFDSSGHGKRRLIKRGAACNTCYSRKVRCDGKRPACGSCQKSSRPCHYASASDDAPDSSSANQSDPLPSGNPSDSSVPLLESSPSGCLNDMQASAQQNTFFQDNRPLEAPPAILGSFLPHVGINVPYDGQSLPRDWTALDWAGVLNLEPSNSAVEPTSIFQSSTVAQLVSQQEQNELLVLYFTNQRVWGLEMHISSFYTRLYSLQMEERPHDCLVLSMILVTCRALSSTAVKEDDIFLATHNSIFEALGSESQLLDASRAAVLLSVWLLSKGKYPLAWTMIGLAARAAIMCGLNMIPSSRFRPRIDGERMIRRHYASYLRSAQSQLELADRIYAFWAVFFVDRCAAIGWDWQPALDHHFIITPLPRPWYEFEGEDTLASKDERLVNVMHPTEEPDPHARRIEFVDTIKSVFLMQQASLPHLFLPPVPLSSGLKYESLISIGSLSSTHSIEVEAALKHLIGSIPPGALQATGRRGVKTLSPSAATLVSLLKRHLSVLFWTILLSILHGNMTVLIAHPPNEVITPHKPASRRAKSNSVMDDPPVAATIDGGPAIEIPVEEKPHRFRYEIVQGFFLQNWPKPKTFEFEDLLGRSFGLIDQTPQRWQNLKRAVNRLQAEAPQGVTYKVFFLGRHGEGWHNNAVKILGVDPWEAYWTFQTTNGSLTWGPDPALSDLGHSQARAICETWRKEAAAGAPVGVGEMKWYVSPLLRTGQTLLESFGELLGDARPEVWEDWREIYGSHTCDKRSPRSTVEKNFPQFDIEPGMSEEDLLWKPDERETDAHMQMRGRRALDRVFGKDGAAETYISVTSHSAFLRNLLAVLGHQPYPLSTGEMIPVVVKATRTVNNE